MEPSAEPLHIELLRGHAQDDEARLEHGLALAMPPCHEAPRQLHRAMHDAVFPGGRRIRPRLALAVAQSMPPGAVDADLVLRAACSIELIHCASLVHDDLPTFDDAPMRRGRAAVHAVHGESTAVLVGDALLALAFEHLAAPCEQPARALRICRRLALATGSRFGIIGGQSLEDEDAPATPLQIRRYHDLKTAPLFRIATEVGALASGAADPDAWGAIGHWLGAAFQLADDLYDHGSADGSGHDGSGNGGKPIGRDAALGRPNAANALGEATVRIQLREHLDRARAQARARTSVPYAILAIVDEVERALQGRAPA